MAPSTPMWETRTELLAPGFGPTQIKLLWPVGSNQQTEDFFSLPLYFFLKQLKKPLKKFLQTIRRERYLRQVAPIQWKPFQAIFEHIPHMSKSVLPDGQHVSNDPVNCRNRTQSAHSPCRPAGHHRAGHHTTGSALNTLRNQSYVTKTHKFHEAVFCFSFSEKPFISKVMHKIYKIPKQSNIYKG